MAHPSGLQKNLCYNFPVMHTPETRQKFVERRVQGWSLVRIATELGVARSTLIEWSRQSRFEIQNLLAIELDDLRIRLLIPRVAA